MKRRTFTTLASVGGAVTAFNIGRGARADVKEIRMIESGGKSGESIDEYIKPFRAKTGVNCVRESPSSLGKLRAMVESGKITACQFEQGSGGLTQSIGLNLVEPLDWDAIAPDPMFPEAKHKYGLGYQYFSTVMAWRKGVKEPKSWADFFNTKDFPGKRSLPEFPHYCLAFVLLSEGVTPDKLFPLDVDRALKKLGTIKKDIAVLWKAGAQPPQLLKDNEVQYAISWSGRVVGEQQLAFTFNQGMFDLSYITVPKGAAKEEQALGNKLFHEMTVAANQAKAAEIISYTGCSPNLEALLPKEKLNEFPTTKANKALQWQQNAEWWRDNGEMANKKWEEFRLSL